MCVTKRHDETGRYLILEDLHGMVGAKPLEPLAPWEGVGDGVDMHHPEPEEVIPDLDIHGIAMAL